MKKYIKTFALCASIALALSGCSTDSTDEDFGQKTNAPEQNNAHTNYIPDESSLPLERIENPDGLENSVVKPNTMTVCRSAEEFGCLFPERGNFGNVDYSKNSVIVVRVATLYGIANISYSFNKADGSNYKLTMTVTTNACSVLDGDFLIFKTDILPQDAVVDFELTM